MHSIPYTFARCRCLYDIFAPLVHALRVVASSSIGSTLPFFVHGADLVWDCHLRAALSLSDAPLLSLMPRCLMAGELFRCTARHSGPTRCSMWAHRAWCMAVRGFQLDRRPPHVFELPCLLSMSLAYGSANLARHVWSPRVLAGHCCYVLFQFVSLCRDYTCLWDVNCAQRLVVCCPCQPESRQWPQAGTCSQQSLHSDAPALPDGFGSRRTRNHGVPRLRFARLSGRCECAPRKMFLSLRATEDAEPSSTAVPFLPLGGHSCEVLARHARCVGAIAPGPRLLFMCPFFVSWRAMITARLTSVSGS